jgi:hypothetical protein
MTRRRKRKVKLTQQAQPKPLANVDAAILSVAWLLTMLIMTFTVIGALWVVVDSKARRLPFSYVSWAFSFLWCLFLWLNGKYLEQYIKLFKKPLDYESGKKLRPVIMRILSLQPFLLLLIWMPVLRAYGYTTRFSDWLFAWVPTSKISENLSVAIAFIAGAIVSGIVGNFSYDLIKFAVKKVYGQK